VIDGLTALGIEYEVAAQWAEVAQGETVEAMIKDVLRRRTLAREIPGDAPPNTQAPEYKPKTSVEFLRELLGTHRFYILLKDNKIAEGYVVTAINSEVAIVDIWTEDDKEHRKHYIPFNQMGWDEFTKTGFMFGRLPEPP
jgi:hypothetical protein